MFSWQFLIMGLIVLSVALAILLGLGMVWLMTKQYPRFQLEGIHWLFVLVCMGITAVSLVTAFESSRALSLIKSNSNAVYSYTGIIDNILGLDEDLSLSQVADDVLKSIHQKQKQKVVTGIVVSAIIAVVANSLTFYFIQREGRKKARRGSRKGVSGSYHSTSDNF